MHASNAQNLGRFYVLALGSKCRKRLACGSCEVPASTLPQNSEPTPYTLQLSRRLLRRQPSLRIQYRYHICGFRFLEAVGMQTRRNSSLRPSAKFETTPVRATRQHTISHHQAYTPHAVCAVCVLLSSFAGGGCAEQTESQPPPSRKTRNPTRTCAALGINLAQLQGCSDFSLSHGPPDFEFW